jgi:hypothetical protein
MKRVGLFAVSLMSIFAACLGGMQTVGASNASGPNGTVCTKYKLFYDLTGTGNDYLSTSLKVCSNHTFSTGQHSGGTWTKALEVYTFTFTNDAVYQGEKTAAGFNSKKKPGVTLVPSGGIWYATRAT